MPTQVSGDPTAVSLLSWTRTGGSSDLNAITTDDGDTSFVRRGAQPGGTDEDGSAYAQFQRAFTGLPANAQITRVGFVVSSRNDSGIYTGGVRKNVQNQGWYPGWTTSTSYSTTVVQWTTVSGLTADGSGNFTATVQVAAGSDLLNGQQLRISYFQLYLEYNTTASTPTLTSPSGTVSTLTPTFTGTYSDPDGDTMAQVEIEVRRVSDNALFWSEATSTSVFSVGYAGTTLVNGTQYKWRARVRDSVIGSSFSSWSGFTNFTPQTNQNPTATVVSPTGGVGVGTLTPTLQFSYYDPDGDAQSAYQILVRRASDLVSFWDSGQVASAVTSATYAGTALSNNITYEWSVRVQDSKGAWSSYSGWSQFQAQATPNAPTITSPSGLTNTLTPTIQGAYNQGSGGTESAFQYEIQQNAVTIYASGDVATVIATGQAYGTNNPSDTPSTPPALAWGTSYNIRMRSKDNASQYSQWTGWSSFNTNSAPTTPTSLTPDNEITGDTTPTISWVHNDPDSDAQTEADIELRKASDDSVVTGYGPKTLSQATLTHDVTQTLTASPATQYKYRVRTKGTAGPGYGPWSDWKFFTVATAPTVNVTVPTVSQVLTGSTLNVTWSLSGGSGTQQSYRVKMLAADQVTVVYDSGVVSGPATSQAITPTLFQNNTTYYIVVILVDTLAQTAQSSNIPITTSWTAPDTVTGLVVVATGSQS